MNFENQFVLKVNNRPWKVLDFSNEEKIYLARFVYNRLSSALNFRYELQDSVMKLEDNDALPQQTQE